MSDPHPLDRRLPSRLRTAIERTPPRARRAVLAAATAFAVAVASLVVVAATTAYAANHTVTVKNIAFSPSTLTVTVGDTVTWVNQETDGTSHTVAADGGAFISGNIAPGGSFSFTFTSTGTFNYHCTLHPFMTGTVIVTATPTSPSPTPSAAASPSASPPASSPPPPSASPPASPAASASPSPAASASPSGPLPCANPTVGAAQNDGTRLATFTTAADGTKVFLLCMAPVSWEVKPGDVRPAYAFNGIVPGPTIKVNEGDKVRVVVQNNLPEHSGVHWHGMQLPNDQDGVPHLTQPPIMPGDVYTYQWTAASTGTHWYHTHMGGTQVGKGLYGALLVTPTLGDIAADKHYTLEIGDGANGFTLNGKSYPATVPLTAKVNQRVHIRLVGTGPEMLHPMHLHGMTFQVVAQDGNKLATPYTVDTLTVAVGQTYDIVTQPKTTGTWLLHCHIFSHAEGPTGMTGLATTLDVTP
ncbi:multicopper oxidase domain-containing protein [Catellatospora citrea]|uniref:multicopper oxidase domain-containing protein n=1 Tax=Catellatospora citrea TaxID=53366 RepID=UPI0033CA4274